MMLGAIGCVAAGLTWKEGAKGNAFALGCVLALVCGTSAGTIGLVRARHTELKPTVASWLSLAFGAVAWGVGMVCLAWGG